MPPNVKSSAQPGRPCALFLMPPELDRPLLQQPVRPPFSTRDDDGIPSGSAALGARPGWWGAACLLLQRGLECGLDALGAGRRPRTAAAGRQHGLYRPNAGPAAFRRSWHDGASV